MRTKLGWIPDHGDDRDVHMSWALPKEMPAKHLMQMDFVYDQGELGSCTAQATSGAFQFTEIKEDGSAPIPSRLALYYWTRKDMGTVDYDSGASIRSAIKAAAKHGMCRETLWPYDTSRFNKQPNANALAESSKHKMNTKAYARVSKTIHDLKACLLANNPIVFGFSVYESFMQEETRRTGIMKMPKPGERMIGGHAVLMIGYDESKQAFICKNSWGEYWGLRSLFLMPYAYAISNLCDDHWTIYKVVPLS